MPKYKDVAACRISPTQIQENKGLYFVNLQTEVCKNSAFLTVDRSYNWPMILPLKNKIHRNSINA